MEDFLYENPVKVLIFIFILVASLGSAVSNVHASYVCGQYEKITGFESRFSNFDACYVKRDGRWWRWDEYKMAYATTAKATQP